MIDKWNETDTNEIINKKFNYSNRAMYIFDF